MKNFANYYCGINYSYILYELWELLRCSLSLTLAHKHSKQTVKAGFQK